MSYWERNPNTLKLIIVLAALVFTSISVINFYINITTPNDENLFAQLPGNLYISKSFEAFPMDKEGKTTGKEVIVASGNIINRIDGKLVKNYREFEKLYREKGNNDTFLITIVDLKQEKGLYYKTVKSKLPKDFVFRVDNAAWIVEVYKDGASDRAGIKKGDIILKVNGNTFDDVWELDKIMKSQRSGSFIYYQILRDNEIFEIGVQLAKFGVLFNVLALFIVGLITIAFGTFIGYKRPNLTAARMISLALILLGHFFSIYYTLGASTGDMFTKLRLISFTFSLMFGVPLVLHGRLYFPYENRELISKQWIVLFLYLIGAVGFSVQSLLWLTFNRQLNFMVYPLILMLLYFGLISLIYNKTFTKENRRHYRPILISYTIVLIVLLFIPLLKEIHYTLQYYVVLSILIPISYFYTISKHRLLDFDLRVSRSIMFSTVNISLHITLLAILLLSVYFLAQIQLKLPNIRVTSSSIEIQNFPLPDNINMIISQMVTVLLSFVVLGILVLIRKKILLWINVKFDRIKINFKDVYSKIFETVEIDTTQEKLAETLVKRVGEIIRFKDLGILVLDNDNYFKYQYFLNNNDEFIEFNYLVSKKLISAIKQFKGIFSIDYLPDGIKAKYSENKYRSVLPVKSKGTLLAAFVIGDKLSETTITNDENELLKSVANQAAVSLDNAYLYNKLAQQERIKHELDIARKIQLASLPQNTPYIKGFDIAAVSIPALEVGGDFYDYLVNENGNLSVVIGDVSGKGTSSALYVSKTQGILNTLNEFEISPKELLIRANRRLYRSIEKNYFITSSIISLSKNSSDVRIARAGHLPVYYFNSDSDKVERILPQGIALGITPTDIFSSRIEEISVKTSVGDIFVLISDGITDARNSDGNDFGEYRVTDYLLNNSQKSAKELVDGLMEMVSNFIQTEDVFDDMTVAVVRICNPK